MGFFFRQKETLTGSVPTSSVKIGTTKVEKTILPFSK